MDPDTPKEEHPDEGYIRTFTIEIKMVNVDNYRVRSPQWKCDVPCTADTLQETVSSLVKELVEHNDETARLEEEQQT